MVTCMLTVLLCSSLLDFLFSCACYSRYTKHSSPSLHCFSVAADYTRITTRSAVHGSHKLKPRDDAAFPAFGFSSCWSCVAPEAFFVLPGLCWLQLPFSAGCLWTNTSFTAALLAQAFSTSWFWRVCNERYQEVYVYYMCMSISTLRTHGLSLVSSFHFIVDLPSFTCLRPLRKFRPDTMWLIKDNIKSIASVRLSAVLILPQLRQVLFSCLAWLGQVVHMSCSTISGLVKGRITFFFFSLIICIFSSIWWEFHWRKTTLEWAFQS